MCLDSLVVLNLAQSQLHHGQGHQRLYRMLLGITFVQDSWVARMTGSPCTTLPGACCPMRWQHQALVAAKLEQQVSLTRS